MHATTPFLVKVASSIFAVLSCDDRVIFKGHLPFPGRVMEKRLMPPLLSTLSCCYPRNTMVRCLSPS
jgi:hypothetical protein